MLYDASFYLDSPSELIKWSTKIAYILKQIKQILCKTNPNIFYFHFLNCPAQKQTHQASKYIQQNHSHFFTQTHFQLLNTENPGCRNWSSTCRVQHSMFLILMQKS